MVRVVAQRARDASVWVAEECVGAIQHGLVVLIGIGKSDGKDDVERMANKIGTMRLFEDEQGKMNLSAREVGADMLVVSQFTLYADVSRGRRPSFTGAEAPEQAEQLYEYFAHYLSEQGYRVATGVFGAQMVVRLDNDGPVTIVLDSKEL